MCVVEGYGVQNMLKMHAHRILHLTLRPLVSCTFAGSHVKLYVSRSPADSRSPVKAYNTRLRVAANNRLYILLCKWHTAPNTASFVDSSLNYTVSLVLFKFACLLVMNALIQFGSMVPLSVSSKSNAFSQAIDFFFVFPYFLHNVKHNLPPIMLSKAFQMSIKHA